MTHDIRSRIPRRIFALAACVFALGMSEFMIAGILHSMADSLGRSEPQIALLITVFAAAIVITAPICAVVSTRIGPSRTLTAAMLVFIAAHVLTALVPVFWLIVVLRVAAGISCAAFLSVGAVSAIRSVPASAAHRALAVMIGGLTVSNVIGLPLAAWTGTTFGWQAAFWLVAAIAAAALAALLATQGRPMTPRCAEESTSTFAAEVRVLVRPSLLRTFAIVVLFQGGMFATFSFLQPLLVGGGAVKLSDANAIIAAFGVGTLLGVIVGGSLAHRGYVRNIVGSLIATTVSVLIVLVTLDQDPLVVGIAVFFFGAAAFSISAALNGQVFALAAGAPNLASGVNISVMNLGNALGPAVAGALITRADGNFVMAPLVSLGFLIAALVTAIVASVALYARSPGA